jgi:hypothetical protein
MSMNDISQAILACAFGLALSAATPLPPETVAQIQSRGRDLAQRVRFEEVCRGALERTGLSVKDQPSPIISMDGERWTAWFLADGEAQSRGTVRKVLSCPAGSWKDLQIQVPTPIPQSCSAQARLLWNAIQQLGLRSPEAYLVTVPEPGGGASLYRMPRPDATGTVLLGQDFRVTWTPGAKAPFVFTRFHRGIWSLSPEGMGAPKDAKVEGAFHTHIDGADPCETDVACAILNGKIKVWVLGKDCMHQCSPDGTLSFLPTPKGVPSYEGAGGPARGEISPGFRAFSLDGSALDLENQWAIQPAEVLGSYTIVCPYLDLQAGFTLEIGGRFILDEQGHARPDPDWPKDKMSLKVRMVHDVVAAPMPPGILKDLGLPSLPDFLASYRPAKETPETLCQRAFHLNQLQECQRAISILEPLYRVTPVQPGVAFELAYAYNATRHADLALSVLEAGCRRDSPDRLLLRELAYTYLHLGRFKEAVATYLRCLPLVPESDGVERSEEALNLAFAYGGLKDETSRQEWLAKAKAWAPKGSAVEGFFTQQVK